MILSRKIPSVLLGAALLSACFFGGEDDGSNPGVWHDAYLAGRIDTIRAGLERTRGLAFTRRIHSAVISPEKFRSLVDEDAESYYTPEVDKGVSRELAQMGYFQDTSASMKSEWSDFQGSFPAGYYLPGRDSIYVLTPYMRHGEFLQYGLPHELVHALQDQALDAMNPERPLGGPDYYAGDFGLAHRCLVEGDAEFTAYAYDYRSRVEASGSFTYAENEARRRNNGLGRWQNSLPEDRLFLPRTSPYDMGMRLASDLAMAGGFAALDARHGRSGLSSLTVLTGGTEAPEAVDLDWLPSMLDTAGAFVDDYGNGALYLMALLGSSLSAEAFNKGMGWRGDRVFYRKRPADRWGALVWVLSFGTQEDAAHALSKLSSVIAGRFRANGPLAPEEYAGDWDQGEFRQAGGLETFLIRKGRQVWWVEGAGDRARTVIDTLVNRSVTVLPAAKRGKASGGGRSRVFPPGGGKVYLHSWK